MKGILQYIIVFLMPYTIIAQSKSILPDKFSFIARPDSIIKITNEGYIYITTDTSSKIYSWIIPKPNDIYVSTIYADYIEHIKNKHLKKINKFQLNSIPKAWNSVYLFKNQFLLYAPSDWIANSGFYISDSVIFITSSDPSDLYVIEDFQTLQLNTWQFTTTNYAGEQKIIRIEPLNKLYGIYSWNILNKDQKLETTTMMQNSDFSKMLPMIVNDCGNNKCVLEFNLETSK